VRQPTQTTFVAFFLAKMSLMFTFTWSFSRRSAGVELKQNLKTNTDRGGFKRNNWTVKQLLGWLSEGFMSHSAQNQRSHSLAYEKFEDFSRTPTTFLQNSFVAQQCVNIQTTRMWANAQPDGRPAKHRRRPLFNAAKFGWRLLLDAVQ